MGWLGHARHDLDVVESTQTEATALARAGAAHGTVVTAKSQRAGRGRRGRSWVSPPGGLYLSCVLRPGLAPNKVPPISLAAGIAVCDVARALGAQNARLKWPNDVLVGTAKLAGILAESSARGGQVEHVILGIGLNVAQPAFPPPVANIATSLVIEAGCALSPLAALDRLLPVLERWLDTLFAGGVAAIAHAWTERAELSRPLVAQGPEGSVRGRAVGLDEAGALILVDDAGRRHTIAAGDVAID